MISSDAGSSPPAPSISVHKYVSVFEVPSSVSFTCTVVINSLSFSSSSVFSFLHDAIINAANADKPRDFQIRVHNDVLIFM